MCCFPASFIRLTHLIFFFDFPAQRIHFIFSVYQGGRNGDLHGTIMMEDRHLSPEFRTKSKYAEYIDEKNLPEKYRTPKRTPPTVSEPYNATVFHLIKDLIVDPRFSPLMADDLSGLPAAMIVAQNFDVLRDDGLLYAKRLRDFGVETVVHEGKGYHADHMRHAMESIQARTGIKANKDICDFIRKIAREN